MACTQTEWLDNREYLRRFNQEAARLQIPLSGSLDLTHRCNLRCIHCYLGPREIQSAKGPLEMTTAQVLFLIDQITEAGCLSFLITGGEPLIRKDFGEIYRHARTNGLLVTVFTNGTLITDEILALFTDLPPQAVEITLYGATAGTYERIAGVTGSHERCLTGIQRLKDYGITVKLKTILMRLNRHEFFDMEKMAEQYDAKFRFDAAIFPRFNGDKMPLGLRVSPEEAMEKEFADKDKIRRWRNFFTRFGGEPASTALYQCGAGLTNFHIDPYGNLQPCLMAGRYKYKLPAGGFLAAWREFMPRIREKQVHANCGCSRCEKKSLCGFCPPFFELESGSEDSCSEYLCALGHLRFEAIQNITLGESRNDHQTAKEKTIL